MQIHKPRSVFWEHLILDSRSDFRQRLRTLADFDSDALLGHIGVEPSDDLQSGIEDLFIGDEPEFNEAWFRSFGSLAAFCTAFGISDLHFENTLFRKNGLQIVDLECLFSDLQLVSETLLIPKTPDLRDRSALTQKLHLQGIALGAAELTAVLSGVDQMFGFLIHYADVFSDFFASRTEELSKHPIRVLLRPTWDYARHMRGGLPIADLSAAEQEQISRGDIPYFFSYAGSETLYHYSGDTQGRLEAVEVAVDLFRTRRQRLLKQPSELLRPARLERIWKQALLDLASKLTSREPQLLQTNDASIEFDGHVLKVMTRHQAVQARLGALA